jgi:hypothetical protein
VSVHKAYIIDAATDVVIEAELHDDLKADTLLDVEAQWAPSRRELWEKLTNFAVPRQKWPESLHWDWGRKGVGLALTAPDDYRVMAICSQATWEGVVITRCKNHVAMVAPGVGNPLVYIDYLEVAPWNWTVEPIQRRKYKAVGPVLLRAAIEQSYALGWAGCIGLHALPQAVSFYERQGLQFVQNDPSKQNLPYFELSAAEAKKRMGRR